jgi:hypothetical protein
VEVYQLQLVQAAMVELVLVLPDPAMTQKEHRGVILYLEQLLHTAVVVVDHGTHQDQVLVYQVDQVAAAHNLHQVHVHHKYLLLQ